MGIQKSNIHIQCLIALLALFITQHVNAQDSLSQKNIVPQKDIIDVFRSIKKQTTPRADTNAMQFSVLPAAGYSLQTGFAIVLSANGAFYTDKQHDSTAKLSSIFSSFTYSQYNQIIFPLQASIWTKNNSYNIITDWRYLEYPSTTFGLGGKSDINNGYTINFNYLKLHQTILKKVSNNLFAGLGYYYDHFWNVQQVGVPPGITTDFQHYGLSNTVTSSGIALRLLYDSRTNQINPNNGWFGNLVYRPNFTFMGSDNNWQSLLIELRKYIPFPSHSKNVLAFWSYNWLTVGGKPPYLMLPSTGWDDFYNTGRGYIQGRYRGRNLLYLESEYRFGITANGLIGGVVFANAESVPREISKQFNKIAPAYGAGVRIKLNKFSNTNLCIDYGFGIEGSHGISVNLGEVF